MTKEQFSESMAYLGLAYGKKFTHQEIGMYYDFLQQGRCPLFTEKS